MIIAILIATALLMRAQARQLREVAFRYEEFATLRFAPGDAEETTGWARSLLEYLDPSAPARRGLSAATIAYWQGQYDALIAGGGDINRDPDPESLLIVANAAFRESQRSPRPRQEQVQQLDLVLQSYATVLKSPVFVPDAAYNYEYVARMRDAFARARGNAAARPEDKTGRVGDLPAGPTIHGQPGGPPPETKGEQFEILTPMEFGDREAQPEATPGVKPIRRG